MRHFEESEFSSIFRCTYCSHIIEISCQRAKFRLAFCSMDNKISLKISFGKVKFRATVYLGSEISWNISFVGVEIKLNVLRRTIFKYTHTHWILKRFLSISKQAAFTVTNCMRSRTEETRRFPFIPLSFSDWLIRKHHPIKDEQTARQLQAVTPKIGYESLELLTPDFFYIICGLALRVLDGVQAEITALKRRMDNKDQRSKTHPARTPKCDRMMKL